MIFKNKIFIFTLLFFQSCIAKSEGPKLLIKIPTRARAEKFFEVLDLYYVNLSNETDYQFLITCDIDDPIMNQPEIIDRLKKYPNLTFSFGRNTSKIEAYNKDIDSQDFDVLLVASDDMIPIMHGYDKIIIDKMRVHFPQFNGVLNFHDGNLGGELNTYPVIGRKFYDRFGYIYHPSYHSLACYLELTEVSRILKKEAVCPETLLRHDHPWFNGNWDELYRTNEKFMTVDSANFHKRKAQNFHLEQKKWSILIPSLIERKDSFNRIRTKLENQIKESGLEACVEILTFVDNREYTIGFKRNYLLNLSSAEYTSFIDDDDDVHEQYISMIYKKLLNNPDCVSLTGIMTTDKKNPRVFIHSITYNSYFERDNIYYRPPNHLNPIKRSLAIQATFPENNFGEDTAWAMELTNKGLIKTEATIDEPYYFYLYDPYKQ